MLRSEGLIISESLAQDFCSPSRRKNGRIAGYATVFATQKTGKKTSQKLDIIKPSLLKKCTWALSSQSEEKYHDFEWGVPVHDDRLLFEFLILEGAQAGLSWSTILNKREGYRKAFDNFNAEKIAQYNESKIQQLLNTPAIVRNKLKVSAAVSNAKAFLAVQQQYDGFSSYIWQFVNSQTKQNHWQSVNELPVSTVESESMSKDLKQKGFKFVGPTICYAYMQAVGMVNDHTVDCFRHQQVKELASE